VVRDRADRDLVALADRDRAGRAALVDPVGLAVREDMNLAALGIMDMDLDNPAALADRASLVGLEDMSLVGLGVREGMNLAGLADRASRGARDRVDPVGPEDRDPRDRDLAARGLSQRRAHRRRNLPDLHPTLAHLHPHLHPMRAHLRRTRDRLPVPTHPGVATHLPVPIHLPEAIHPAEATHLAEATHPGAATREADTEGVKREFSSQSSGFAHAARNCLGAPSKTVCITAPADAGCPARQVRFLQIGSDASRRLSPS
jgi:hypothetical protein